MVRIDPITWLSKVIMCPINRFDLINKVFDVEDYVRIQKWIKKYRKRDVVVTDAHIKRLCVNGSLMVSGEVLKYLIVLSIAFFLKILLPTFYIMTVFSLMRFLAGGVHMSSFNKCFAVMILVFLSLGYLVSQLHINLISMIIGYILSLLFAIKYAPQERSDKSDKDCENGNKRKHAAILFVILFCITSVLLNFHNPNIGVSIFIGVLLEMFTVTPIGTKFFNWIDRMGGLND